MNLTEGNIRCGMKFFIFAFVVELIGIIVKPETRPNSKWALLGLSVGLFYLGKAVDSDLVSRFNINSPLP